MTGTKSNSQGKPLTPAQKRTIHYISVVGGQVKHDDVHKTVKQALFDRGILTIAPYVHEGQTFTVLELVRDHPDVKDLLG